MDLETRRRLAAIRRLSRAFPARNAGERLKRIVEIASGTLDPNTVRPRVDGNDMVRRLAEGQASRSKRTAADHRSVAKPKVEEEEPKPEPRKRKVKGKIFNREETGGLDRGDEGSE